jgi:hypothetical protein
MARALIVLAVIGVLGVGASVLVRRATVTAFFLLGYLAIVVVWPYAPDRFLWGVWPLVLLTLAMGAVVGIRGARQRRADGLPLVAHATLVVAAGALAVGLVRYNARGYQKQWWDTSQRAIAHQLVPLATWVEHNTRPGDVIASDGDPLLHLYTGRFVVPASRWAVEAYPDTPDSASRVADLRELLATYHVRYLLLSTSKSHSAGATRVLAEGAHPSLHMLTVLAAGGAVFTTAPGINRE